VKDDTDISNMMSEDGGASTTILTSSDSEDGQDDDDDDAEDCFYDEKPLSGRRRSPADTLKQAEQELWFREW
jgi:hypothetical protein